GVPGRLGVGGLDGGGVGGGLGLLLRRLGRRVAERRRRGRALGHGAGGDGRAVRRGRLGRRERGLGGGQHRVDRGGRRLGHLRLLQPDQQPPAPGRARLVGDRVRGVERRVAAGDGGGGGGRLLLDQRQLGLRGGLGVGEALDLHHELGGGRVVEVVGAVVPDRDDVQLLGGAGGAGGEGGVLAVGVGRQVQALAVGDVRQRRGGVRVVLPPVGAGAGDGAG